MLQVKQIVNNIFTSNTYLLFDDDYDYCWLIDIGDFEKVANAIPSGVEVRGVFLTHTHFDHTYGINVLHKAYPNCCVYTAEYGKVALYDEKKNFSRYHEAPFVYEGTDVAVLQDNEKVEIYPGLFITAIATPGHCPSCLTYVLNDWIFTGDSYIPNVKVVTKLPNGDRKQAKQSRDIILQMALGKNICPGHGEIV
ncbi:MAG: MBL fold metallo-hydrolase [Bacteroidales bacterium]|nr:MBL fold metallo-hydrolase [Bacteroidales bacterium]